MHSLGLAPAAASDKETAVLYLTLFHNDSLALSF